MKYNLKKDKEDLARMYEEANSIVQSADIAGREMNEGEKENFDSILARHTELEKSVARKEKLNGLANEKEEKVEKVAERAQKSTDEVKDNEEQVRRAFTSFLRHGIDKMPAQEREIFMRAQSSGTNSEGGYTVDSMIADRIVEQMAYYGGMRDACTVISTSTGGTLNYPTNNDTANVGEWLAENTGASAQDTVFGNVALGAHKASSDYILVSNELIQDSAFDIEAYLTNLLAKRLGRLTNTGYTTGSGSGQPTGIDDVSTFGATTAATTTITVGEYLDLKHSVDRDYRTNGAWMINDSTLLDLKKKTIASGDDRPLWQPSYVTGEPATIDGDRYYINNDLPDIAAGAHSVLYGDFSQYVIRDTQGVSILRSEHLNMLANQMTYVGFLRTDGNLIRVVNT
jgi:HK97 family phage major capsid protein